MKFPTQILLIINYPLSLDFAKNHKPLLMTFLVSIFFGSLYGQNCLPNGITFSTQSSIDNFSINYPGCTEIDGTVFIKEDLNQNITNLIGLSQLTSCGALYIEDNASLSSLNGLNALTSVENDLFIINNDNLTDLNGLNNLSNIDFRLNISDNDILTSLVGLNSLTNIPNRLTVNGNTSLVSLEGLNNLQSIGSYLQMNNNTAIQSLAALSNLTTIDGFISISNQPNLTTLSGLENISPNTITNITIADCNNLSICNMQSICDWLLQNPGQANISGNANGCESEPALQAVCMGGNNLPPCDVITSSDLCTSINTNNASCNNPATIFQINDEINARVSLDNISAIYRVIWTWKQPDGSIYSESISDWTNSNFGNHWFYATIIASIPGNWSIDLSVENQQGEVCLNETLFFTVQGGGNNDCYDSSVITGNPCVTVYAPVCGCNGLTYSNDCFALESGIPTSTQGECWVNCPTLSNEILCQPWVVDYLQTIVDDGGYNIEITNAELGLNKFTVFSYNIIDNNHVDIYNCAGTLIQSCNGGFTPWMCTYTTTNINLTFPDDFTSLSTIWDDSQNFPDCNGTNDFCDSWFYSLIIDCDLGNLVLSDNTGFGNSYNADYECSTNWDGPEIIADYMTTTTKSFFFNIESPKTTTLMIFDDCSPTANCVWQTSSSGSGGNVTLPPGTYYFVVESLGAGSDFEVTFECLDNCTINSEEVLCESWLQNLISFELINNSCGGLTSVYSGEYQGEDAIMIVTNCSPQLETTFKIYDCEGQLIDSCADANFSANCLDFGQGIDELIWQSSEEYPDCNNDCPTNPDDVLCLDWIQNRLAQAPEVDEIAIGTYQGQDVILIGHSYCPIGVVCIIPGVVDIYTCTGDLLSTFDTVIEDPEPGTFTVTQIIYSFGDNIPNCTPPSNCGDSTFANLQFILNPVITTSGSTVQIPVTVENFGDSIQFFFYTLTIEDGAVFQPTTIVDAALNISNWSVVGDEIEVSWENSTQPALADGTVIFYVEGTIVGDAGTCTTVSFTDNLTGDIAVYAITADLMLEEVEAGYTASNVCAVDATTGLSCATPLNIFCPSITPGSNENGTSNFDLYGCSNYFMNGNESVHQVDIDGPQDVIVTLSGLSADLELIILDECQPEDCIAYSFRSNNSSESIIVEDLDGTYYIIVDGYLEASSGYILELDCPDAGDLPSGQLDCSAAINIGCDETVSGETCNGSNNVVSYCTGSQSDYESGQEVVYSFTLTEARWLIFTLSDFTEDLDMFLLSGDDCSASDCIFTFNNSGLTEETHQLSLGVGSYYIVVDGFNGAQSSFQLSTICGTDGGPPQDFNCDDATQISCDNSPIMGNNGTGSNNVNSHCGTFNTGPELIYEFVLDNQNTVEFILSQMTADLNMFIYSDCTVDSECIASSTKNDLSDEGIKLLDMEAGSYFIVIDGYNGAISDFVLTLDCEPMEVTKSGSVYTEYMAAVPDVMMVCSDGVMQVDTFTNEDGDYIFAPVPGGQDYNVTAMRDGNDKDGITFFDKSLLQLYIQNSPAVVFSNYTKIAADVNGDGCIAQDDALILGDVASASPTSSSEFMNVDSWRFVPASYDLDNAPTNCNNPFITIPKFQVPAFEEAIVLPNLTQDTDGLDFIGVKMGDLNLDWEPGAPQLLAPETVWLNVPAVSFSVGEEKEIILSSTDYEEVLAFEISLKYHQEDLEIISIIGGFGNGTIDFDEYQLEDSDTEKIAYWSWITGDNQSRVMANLPYVLKLTIKANKALDNIQNYLWIKPNGADCTAISSDLVAKSVGLNKDFINSTTNLEKNGMNLTVFPNPFSETTNVQFILQQPAAFKLNIYNVLGALVAQKEVQGESGSNLIPIDHRDLPEKGMYYLELINETQSLRATMLFH